MQKGDKVFVGHKGQVLECEIVDYNNITGIYTVDFMNGLIKLLRSRNRIAETKKEAETFLTLKNV